MISKALSQFMSVVLFLAAVSVCCAEDMKQNAGPETHEQKSSKAPTSTPRSYANQYVGQKVMQRYFFSIDYYINNKRFAKAEEILEQIKNTYDYDNCVPESVCHAVRAYEDQIKNESGQVNYFPKITGVYSHVGSGGAYTYFCVQSKKKGEKCFTAYGGCEFKGDPRDGHIVTVYYDPMEEDRAVKVVNRGPK